jgi:hypothetical protein
MKRNDGKVRQCSVKGGVWNRTESAITPNLEWMKGKKAKDGKGTTLTDPAQIERVIIALSGGKLTHRGFIRGVRAAIKAGHDGLDKFLPGYVAPAEDEGPLEFVMAAD